MALTGLFLSTFLVVHLLGNLQLFKSDGGLAFNTYAVFMTTNPLIKFVSYGLYALILLHALDGIQLTFYNRKARGSASYASFNNQSSWASRNMALLGTILLVYIVVHMGDFWFKYKFGYVPYTQYTVDLATGGVTDMQAMPAEFVLKSKIEEQLSTDNSTKTVIVKDLYKEVEESFKNPILVLVYILGMIAVSFHMVHGFQSAFQTLGINHRKYNPLIHFLGKWVFSILIPAAFAAMPVFFFFKSL